MKKISTIFPEDIPNSLFLNKKKKKNITQIMQSLKNTACIDTHAHRWSGKGKLLGLNFVKIYSQQIEYTQLKH